MPATKNNPEKKKDAKRKEGFSYHETTLRHLAVLELIPRAPDSITAEEIHQALEDRLFLISKRTIQRDLDGKLSRVFKLVFREDGVTKHWSYADDAPVRIFPSMDEHTALSFQLMRVFLKPLLPPETLENIAPWFKQSAERLSQRKVATAKWQEKIHVLPLGLQRQPPTIDPKIMETVYEALLHEQSLKIHYRKRGAKSDEEYHISPLGLVLRDYVCYVVAAKNVDGEIRQFLLHRFKKASKEGAKYSRPAGFNLAAYAEKMGVSKSNAPTIMGESTPIELELWMDEDAAISVAECPVSKGQQMKKQADGSFILSATVQNTQELHRWIYSFGKQVEIMQPGYLRAEVAEEIATMSKRYEAKLTSS